jgi:hypothetical protein
MISGTDSNVGATETKAAKKRAARSLTYIEFDVVRQNIQANPTEWKHIGMKGVQAKIVQLFPDVGLGGTTFLQLQKASGVQLVTRIGNNNGGKKKPGASTVDIRYLDEKIRVLEAQNSSLRRRVESLELIVSHD